MKKVAIYNPLESSFSTTYDISGKGIPEVFTIEGYKAAEFDPVVAEHVRKHLITHIVNERGVNPLLTDKIEEIAGETYIHE